MDRFGMQPDEAARVTKKNPVHNGVGHGQVRDADLYRGALSTTPSTLTTPPLLTEEPPAQTLLADSLELTYALPPEEKGTHGRSRAEKGAQGQ